MKKGLTYLLFVGLTTFFSYNLTIKYLPNFIYGVFHYKMKNDHNINDNELKFYNLPNDKSKVVVMPNPDFLYVVSFYDIRNGPLNLTGKMPDSTYWSISFYKSNTINWYVKNDKEFKDNHLNIVLLDYDEISYRVINMLGQTVDSGQLKSQQVNVENLESGMYFIEINDGDEVFIKKFIRR